MNVYFIYGFLALSWIGLIWLAARNSIGKLSQHLCSALLVFLTVIFLWMSSYPTFLFRDFHKAYFPAGKIIVENRDNLYYSGDVLEGFVNIPIVALLFTPLSNLNKTHALFVFSGLGLFTILSTLFFFVRPRDMPGWRRVAILGVFALSGPLYYSFKLGNTTHLILLLLLIIFLRLGTGRQLQAGILLAIVAIIKMPFLLFAGYLVLRKYWTALAAFGITMVVLVASSLFFFGIPLHRTWLDNCMLPFRGKAIGAFNVQSIDSFWVRLLTENNATHWNLVPIDSFEVVRYSFLIVLFLLVIATCWSKKTPHAVEEKHLELSIVLCLTLVISPVSWTHYYLLLLLPFSLYLQNQLAVPEGKLSLTIFVIIVLLVSPPVISGAAYYNSDHWLVDLLVSRLFVSHYLIGAFLFLVGLLAAKSSAPEFQRARS